jgi:PAS domain-containing protein
MKNIEATSVTTQPRISSDAALAFQSPRTAMIIEPAARPSANIKAATEAGEDIVRLTLDNHGLIKDCNRICEVLFKYSRDMLCHRHVSLLVPQLADFALLQDGQINPQLRYLCRIGQQFEAVNHNGERFATELFFNVLDSSGQGQLSLIVRAAQQIDDISR